MYVTREDEEITVRKNQKIYGESNVPDFCIKTREV